MKNVTWVDVKPADRTERVIAAQHSEPGAVVAVPAVWHVAGTAACNIEPKYNRQVHEDDVLGAQREVVHHG